MYILHGAYEQKLNSLRSRSQCLFPLLVSVASYHCTPFLLTYMRPADEQRKTWEIQNRPAMATTFRSSHSPAIILAHFRRPHDILLSQHPPCLRGLGCRGTVRRARTLQRKCELSFRSRLREFDFLLHLHSATSPLQGSCPCSCERIAYERYLSANVESLSPGSVPLDSLFYEW